MCLELYAHCWQVSQLKPEKLRALASALGESSDYAKSLAIAEKAVTDSLQQNCPHLTVWYIRKQVSTAMMNHLSPTASPPIFRLRHGVAVEIYEAASQAALNAAFGLVTTGFILREHTNILLSPWSRALQPGTLVTSVAS